MYPLTAFLLAVSGAMLIGLVLVLAWAVARERHYERQLAQKDEQYAQALRREGELSAQAQRLTAEQGRLRLRVRRLEERHAARGELIRDLGIDPERLEQTRESLLGVLAILRIRIGMLLVADLSRVALRDAAAAAGGHAHRAFQQLDARLQGNGGPQHDQQSRQLLREMVDVGHMERPLAETTEEMTP